MSVNGAEEMGQARVALVVAMDRNRGIGRRGELPWHLPDDLRHFKQLTLGRPLLMGRATFESIGRPLPQRRNLVLSRNPRWSAQGAERVGSLAEALALCADQEWLMVIGGAQVYAEALPLAHRIYLCEVEAAIADVDTWFPQLERAQWTELSRVAHQIDARHAYGFSQVMLERTVGASSG